MKKILRATAFLAVLLWSFTATGATYEYVEVKAKGTGDTRTLAIEEALVEAITKVNGATLGAQNVMALKATFSKDFSATTAASASGGTAAATAGTATHSSKLTLEAEQQRRIAFLTKGMIHSYDVLSESASKLGPGKIDVVLRAKVGKYTLSPQTDRKRIAVVPFRLRAQASPLEREASTLLEQALTENLSQTRRFAVLDRTFLQEKHAEFNLLSGDDVGPKEFARIGNTLGTDYLLVGMINEFSRNVKNEKIPYANEVLTTIAYKGQLTWRLIEAPTGQIISSGSFEDKLPVKGSDDPGAKAFTQRAGETIGLKILDTIYPLMPIAHEQGILTINQGGDAIRPGQRYTLIRLGEMRFDPYTKEALGQSETPVGLVEITSVLPKMSQAKILNTSADLAGFAPRQYILRMAPKSEPAKPVPPKTLKPKW